MTLDLLMAGQLRHLRGMGFHVIAVSSAGPELERIAKREMVSVRAVKMSRRPSPLIDLLSTIRLIRLFRKEMPTIVHSSTPKAGMLGMVAAALARVPVRFYTVRGMASQISTSTPTRIIQLLERTACVCANQVLAVSQSVADALVNSGLCPSHKVKVLLNGSSNGVDAHGMFNAGRVDMDKVRALRKRLHIPAGSGVIGFVGRLVKDKGVVELVQAWDRVKRLRPNNRLLVIGPVEREDSVPESILQSLTDDSSVIMAGVVPKEEMPTYYKMMNVVAFPSYREGFPNVVLEAAAMEVPVVASRVTGCVDAVLHGTTGTLIPPRAPQALAEALLRYLDDPALAQRHGKAGRNRALKDFRPEDLWRALLSEYIRALDHKSLSLPKTNRHPIETQPLAKK